MIVETLRMIEAVLLDPVLGVNAQIDVLALDTPNGVSQTIDKRPVHVTVRCASDDDSAVRQAEETQFPLLIVTTPGPATAQVETWSGIRDSTVDVLLAFVEQGSAPAGNIRAADYTLRAAVRSLQAGLFAPGKRDTAGTRNGYTIAKGSRLRYGPNRQPMQNDMMTAAANFTITVRDVQP
jgi:hypothetical protein